MMRVWESISVVRIGVAQGAPRLAGPVKLASDGNVEAASPGDQIFGHVCKVNPDGTVDVDIGRVAINPRFPAPNIVRDGLVHLSFIQESETAFDSDGKPLLTRFSTCDEKALEHPIVEADGPTVTCFACLSC